MSTNQRLGALRWNNILIIFILVLSISSAGQVTPASAAEASQRKGKKLVTVYPVIVMPTKPVCVNKTSYIVVRTMADTDISLGNGKVNHIGEVPQSGVTVVGSVSDPSIGALKPKQQTSGETELDNPGEATFSFDATKAGIAIITFTPTYPGAKNLPEMKSIKVVNCEYKVTMNMIDVDSGAGFTIWITGQFETKISGENNALQGNGSFDMVSGFVGPPCSISYSELQNPTTITGKINDDDQLSLAFQYQPGTITSQVSCPYTGGSGSQVVDLTNTGIASADFPENGGSRMLRFQYAGSDFAPGTMIINVEPVEAGG